jgi:hypothetical protein
MELMYEEEIPKKRIVIRLVASKNIYSVPLPVNWTAKKLKAFIQIAFKDQLKDANNISLFFEGKKLADDFKLNTIASDGSENFPQVLVFNNTPLQKGSSAVANRDEPLDSKKLNEIVNIGLIF